MPTTNGNRKILDLKRWEFCTPAPSATVAGAFISSSRHYRQQQLYVVSATVHYLYNPLEDAWVQIPSGAFGGTFAVGACGTATSVGPSGTATAGTTSTITTNLTLARDLRGYSIHITGGGANNGVTLPILSNTVGTNSIITVATQGTAFTASTTYRLLTPRWYVLNAVTANGTTTTALFRFYDFALNTWSNAETGATDGIAPAAVIGTDSKLIATPSWVGPDYRAFATGTATAGGASTLTNSAKTWTTNQWTNYQVRIVSGTGAGQIRTIASNTGTVLTTSAAWTTQPDATSVYSIEGNDDFLYYLGSNAVTLFRYSISAGTWTTLTPSPTARAAAPGLGMSAHWIHEATDAAWTNESAILNGRYIYSFRGTAGAVLDRYDIALNTWTNALTYAPATEVFGGGSKYVYRKDWIYAQKDSTGRWFRYNVVTNEQDGWNTMTYTQGGAIGGDTAFDVIYTDGATEIDYVYMVLNTSTVMLRQQVV
jgi:hypothetical protein